MHLTPRERDILRLLASGHSNKQVAASLNISVHTVRAVLRHARERNDKSTLELALELARDGEQ